MRISRLLAAAVVAVALGASSASAQVQNITNNISANTTWGPTGTVVGTTFWIKNSISINAGVTLTVQPGVVVKFNPGCYLYVSGALQSVGTAPSPIYFTSIKDDNNPAGDTNGDANATTPAASDWQGIYFPNGSTNFASSLSYCLIKYAGYGNYAALTFQNVSQSVSNCTISKSYYGVDCQGAAAPTLSNTTIQASTYTPIVLDFTATPVFSSLVFSSSDNGYDAIGVRGGTLNGSATLPVRGATVGVNPVTSVTYVLLGSLTIAPAASLTISPGVVIKPLPGTWITVQGNLTMNGTSGAGNGIVLTSINDDNFGTPNDTNNNGSITAPHVGDWGGVSFVQGSTGSVAYATLKFGTSYNGYGLIMEQNTSINVSNTLLSDASHGLALFGSSSPSVTAVQINNCTSTPVLQSVSSNVNYSGIGLTANAITAIGLQGEQVGVDSHLIQRTLGTFTNITYYVMNGYVEMLTGATLTVDPGVVIKNQQAGGGFIIDGSLVANGTLANPIVFTSERDDQYGNPADTNGDGATTTPNAGDWTYLHFTSTANDLTCLLNYCRVTYASSQPYDGYAANIWITNASPTITNSIIFKGYYGIRSEGNSAPVIALDQFNNLNAAPIVMSVLSDPQIATNNTYSTNVYNALALISETLSQDARLKYRPNVGNPASPTFCYLPTGTITVATGVTLSIDPQVVLKPSGAYSVFAVNGALNMVGADNGTNRIFVTSALDDALGGDTTPTNSNLPTPGNWGNIVFNATAMNPSCIIRNVKFQFGGSGGNTYGVITTNSASPRCANIEFFENQTAFTFTGASSPSIDSLSILNCTQLPIVSSLISTPVYGATIAFANCSYLGLGILGETIAQDVTLGLGAIGPYTNLNYILAANVTIAFGAKWTIQPGVVIKMGRLYTSDPAGTWIDISGALYASGTPSAPVIFTSMADDAFGQDAMGDGAATQPSAGQWQGIQFEAVSNDAATLLNWCKIRYAGGYQGALSFVSAGPAVSNTQITRSYYPGAYIVGASTPTFTSVDFDSTTGVGVGVPVELSLVSNPVFTSCRFQNNWYTALGVVPENIAQDVLWKIRPCAGRQNMPFFLNGALTIGLNATLTMQPGVIVKGYNGSIDVQRAMTAVGRTNPESLIVFTSWKDDFYGGDSNADSNYTTPAAGDWNFVTIEGTAIDPQVNFKNCVFRYGYSGSSYGALRCVSSAPTVDSTLFAYNGTGLSAEGSSNPLVRGCSFYGNGYWAINNSGNAFCVSAQGCWWGAASGPNDASATADLCGLGANAGTGDAVTNNVNYTGFVTSGIQNPLLGDVSLNGFVMAYDASLVLQANVSLITLTPLQALVADTDNNGAVGAFDATLILQLVAGKIPAFPPVSNGLRRAPPLPAAVQAAVDAARGTFTVALGQATRSGGEWLVPVQVSGTAPVWSVELALGNGDAATLASVDAAGGALSARNVVAGTARVALASADPLPGTQAMVLHFPAGAGDFRAPDIAFARVNQAIVVAGVQPPPPAPSVSFLGRPRPNPAKGPVQVTFALAGADATPHASVRIVDVAGRTLRTLLDGPLGAGEHTLEWNLADEAGRTVPPGMYFVRAHAGGAAFTQRLIVVR